MFGTGNAGGARLEAMVYIWWRSTGGDTTWTLGCAGRKSFILIVTSDVTHWALSSRWKCTNCLTRQAA